MVYNLGSNASEEVTQLHPGQHRKILIVISSEIKREAQLLLELN